MQVATYVNVTKEIGVRFVRGSGLELSVYANADYTAASNDRRSVSDIAVMLGDTAIRWKSSRRPLRVKLSTLYLVWCVRGGALHESRRGILTA